MMRYKLHLLEANDNTYLAKLLQLIKKLVDLGYRPGPPGLILFQLNFTLTVQPLINIASKLW